MSRIGNTIEFNETEYVGKIVSNRDESTMISIKRFFIFWNLFEKTYFNNNFKTKYNLDGYHFNNFNLIQKISQYIMEKKLLEFQEIIKYFNEYFMHGNKIPANSTKENDIIFNKNGIEYFKMIGKIGVENADIDESIMYLIYFIARLRHNLFHGIKNIEMQSDRLFYYANRFISICIDAKSIF